MTFYKRNTQEVVEPSAVNWTEHQFAMKIADALNSYYPDNTVEAALHNTELVGSYETGLKVGTPPGGGSFMPWDMDSIEYSIKRRESRVKKRNPVGGVAGRKGKERKVDM
jgi:hypothetical protein